MMKNLKRKSNQELCYLIRHTSMKEEAWAQLLRQGAMNEDLCYLIEHTSMKEEAWAQLLRQGATNRDLLYLIHRTSMKKEAWVQLLKQNPTNRNLRLLTPQEEMKHTDWVELINAIGLSTNEEKKLITEIAKIVVEDNSRLDMSKWHCGTVHCLAGWACVLDETAARIEAKFHTEMAGAFVLPSYTHLFYASKEEVLRVLENVLTNN